jgi:hypothetical protein
VSASPANGGSVSVETPQPGNFYAADSPVVVKATAAPGYAFQGFTGDFTDSHNPLVFTMNGPKTITAMFIPQPAKTTFVTNPPGRTIQVDGVTYGTPVTFNWGQESHMVSAAQEIDIASAQTRYSFKNWSDLSALATRKISAGATDTTYTANFSTEYQVLAAVTPSAAGTVSGDGWFAAGSSTTLSASAAAGFQFAGFSGVPGVPASSPLVLTVDKPYVVTAAFKATAPPVLYATAGARTDAGNGMVNVPIRLNNVGGGPAGDARIVAITNVTVPQGGGQVLVSLPVNGVPVGTLFPGKSGDVVVQFNWPTTATRVQFTVKTSANGGAYQGSNTITLFR